VEQILILWIGFLTILNIDPHDSVFFSFNFPIFHLAGSLKLASLGLLEFLRKQSFFGWFDLLASWNAKGL
jgi:hypothetical protein